jgi:hypothetical protein
VSFLPPIPPGLPRKLARDRIETAIETETAALIAQARDARAGDGAVRGT